MAQFEKVPFRDQEAEVNRAPWRLRLRILGHLARAVRRLQASLNPKMTFRRRETPEEAAEMERVSHCRSMSAPITAAKQSVHMDVHKALTGRLPNRRLPTGLTGFPSPSARTTHKNRGHMTSYLLAPLPGLKSEASRA